MRRLFAHPCCCLFAASALFFGVVAAEERTSRLWGRAGETWRAAGRLPDYSYAGYHRGERPIPVLAPRANVKDFGAKGTALTDDTAAFERAVEAAAGKVIAIPPGRYVITDIIAIRESGTVLKGAGPDKTVIYVPRPLEHIRSNMGATTTGRPTSNYSWSGGIFVAQGRLDRTRLAGVTSSAKRGASTLVVDQPENFTVGDLVRLQLRDDDAGSLVRHLYDNDPSDFSQLRRIHTDWIAEVVAVDRDSKRVTFDRTLRTDVRIEWQPVLFPAKSSAVEIGIENMSFEFPVTPYKGHFTELGFNAIMFSDTQNCWIRDIEIRHADSGIFVRGFNSTVKNIVWKSDRERDRGRNSTGHHGITLSGADLLFEDFEIHTKFIHDITMSRGSTGNVCRRGRAEDLTCDHHKYANHANLFTDIDAGEGTNIFRSGGGAQLGRHCGAWTTWWNIRTKRPVRFPTGWAPEMINVVGVISDQPATRDETRRWFEPIPPAEMSPRDLYESQLKRRLDRE
jgi:hypothetical protein